MVKSCFFFIFFFFSRQTFQPYSIITSLYTHLQILIGSHSVFVLMVTKGASWQQDPVFLLPPNGAAVAGMTSCKGSQCSILIAVSLISHPCQWQMNPVAMESARGMRSVTVEVHRSARILAAIQPHVSQPVVPSAVLVNAVLALVSYYPMELSAGLHRETVTQPSTALEIQATVQLMITNEMVSYAMMVVAIAMVGDVPLTMLSARWHIVCPQCLQLML